MYIWPNPDGRTNTKPNGQIFDHTAELVEKRRAEYGSTIIPTQFIKANFYSCHHITERITSVIPTQYNELHAS